MNKFLESIKLNQFRIIAEQRKRIALLIKQRQPGASGRAIAKVIGVDEITVARTSDDCAALRQMSHATTETPLKAQAPMGRLRQMSRHHRRPT